MWAACVYLLCLLTSTVCAAFLVRGYRNTRSQLLFWSAICFVMLAINNLLVVVDILMLPDIDLSLWRGVATFIGLACLLYGFIWEAERT